MYFSLITFVQDRNLLQSHYVWHYQPRFKYSSLTIFGIWHSNLIIFAAFLCQTQVLCP